MNPTPTLIQLRSAEISLLNENLNQVITTANYESSVEDVDEINNAIKGLIGDKHYFILVIPQTGSTASSEAKNYAAQESFRNKVIAEAIVISNIALRLAAIAYMKVNCPKQKIKLFNSKEKALRWLHLLSLKVKE